MNTASRAIHDDMKDSHVDWLGQIPMVWEIRKLKFVVKILKRIAGYEGPSVLSITQQGIKVKDIDSGEGQLAQDYSGYQIVDRGDFAMNHMDLLTGYVDISKFDGVVSPDYRVFRNVCADVLDDYLLLIFQIGYSQRIFFRYGQGVSLLGRWRLPADNFNEFLIPIPPLGHQHRIVEFLKAKVSKIDEAVRIKEEHIALLKERRQILIQQAVTRGLNPDAPMKDSGIDWIGEIPAHWSIAKLKFLTKKIVDGTHFTPEYLDEGVPFLRVTDLTQMKDGTIQWDNVRRISQAAHKELSKRAYAEYGDVLLSKNGTIGLTKVIDWHEEFSFFVSLCLIKLRSELNSYYFEAFFNSPLVDQQLFFGSFRTSVTNLHLERIKELFIVVPPIDEQRELVDHIKALSSPLDGAIDLKQSQIATLNEYKTSLINAAVTGKIKVI
nr:restriction endonuclease subunit S [uncultured Cohaesibacter sp.]